MPKPAAKPTPSFDTIATRDLHGAAFRCNLEGLRKALAANANPNDQKKINSWSPPSSPLLKAVEADFAAGVVLLLKKGARRRCSGKDGSSAFAHAVSSDAKEAFKALENTLGGMTQAEIIECFVALTDSSHSYKDDGQGSGFWGVLLIEHLCRHQVKLAPKTAVAVCMNLLGGDGQFEIKPHLATARHLMTQGLLSDKVLAIAAGLEGLNDWAYQLASRKWDEESKPALEMLHDLAFPFGAAVDGMEEGPKKEWLLVQKAEQEQRELSERAPQAASPAVKRLRL